MWWSFIGFGCGELRQFLGGEAAPVIQAVRPLVDGPDQGRPTIAVQLVPVAQGFSEPTDIQFVPGSATRLVVLEKGGQAWSLDLTTGERTQVLDLPVETSSELGLLGWAFHPQFPDVPKVYTDATMSGPVSRIQEWAVDGDLSGTHWTLRPTKVLLEVQQPYANHNAGQLAFGPDGKLYVGFGDGGAADDPEGRAQNPAVRLGKMLRVDVGDTLVPADNPFVGQPGVLPEIFALGLRNPWRYSFAPDGRLVVADVGQNKWEELDLVAAGSNLGWDTREGRICHEPPEGCATEGLTEPIVTYGRDEGSSITGGYVVTGDAVPALRGKYVFGDFVSGRLWAIDLPADQGAAVARTALGRTGMLVSTFGRDGSGNLLLADFGTGALYRVVAP